MCDSISKKYTATVSIGVLTTTVLTVDLEVNTIFHFNMV